MVILELIFKHLMVKLLSLMMLWYKLGMITADRNLGHTSLMINWRSRKRMRMNLNLLKLALTFWVDPLYPWMHLWLIV